MNSAGETTPEEVKADSVTPEVEPHSVPLLPLIFAAAGTFWVWGAAPGMTWLDAGELAAASHELGIAHPPGFPLFSVINKLAYLIIPFGDVAFRGNVSSAIIMGLAAAFVCAIIPRGRVVVVFACACLFIGAPVVTLHGTTIEAYAGSAALVAVGFVLLKALLERKDLRLGLLAVFFLGLGAWGHHPELRLLLAACVIACVFIKPQLKNGLALLTAGFAGAVMLLYLPIRSLMPLWRDWGNPESIQGLWDHFWAARIRAAYGAEMGALDADVLSQFFEQIFLAAPALSIFGALGFILVRSAPIGWVLMGAFTLDLAYSLLINPMGVRDFQNGLIATIALAAASGWGVSYIIERWNTRWVTAIIPGVCLVSALVGFKGFEHREDRGLDHLTNRIGDQAAPKSMVFVTSDNLAAGLAYQQVVHGLRPDVAVIVRQHVGYASSMGPTMRRLPETLSGWFPGANLSTLDRLGTDWPILWEWGNGSDAVHRPTLFPGFPLLTNAPPQQDDMEQQLWTWVHQVRTQVFPGSQSTQSLSNFANDAALFRLHRQEPGLAVQNLKKRLELQPTSAKAWVNLGAGLAAARNYSAAIDVTKRGLSLDPSNLIGQVNLARYLIQVEAWEESVQHLHALIELFPNSADGYGLLGVAFGNRGQIEDARSAFRQALKIDPGQPEAKAGMAQLKTAQ